MKFINRIRTNNKYTRKKSRKQSIHKSLKQHHGLNLTKNLKNLCRDNFKTWKKEAEEDTIICEDIACSLIGRSVS